MNKPVNTLMLNTEYYKINTALSETIINLADAKVPTALCNCWLSFTHHSSSAFYPLVRSSTYAFYVSCRYDLPGFVVWSWPTLSHWTQTIGSGNYPLGQSEFCICQKDSWPERATTHQSWCQKSKIKSIYKLLLHIIIMHNLFVDYSWILRFSIVIITVC